MDYLDTLNDYNNIEGIIIDTDFTKFTKYIDLAKADIVKKREYIIINEYHHKPWQTAFDFTNSIKNRLKKHSKLIREQFSEKHLKLFKNSAIVIFNAEKTNLDIIRITYNHLKPGGVIIVKTNSKIEDLLNKLTMEFPRNILKVNDSHISIRKSDEVEIPGVVKRTNSKLT